MKIRHAVELAMTCRPMTRAEALSIAAKCIDELEAAGKANENELTARSIVRNIAFQFRFHAIEAKHNRAKESAK